MRNYTNFDKYLDELEKDIYPQEADLGHTAWAKDAIHLLCKDIWKDFDTVLDVGCGEGFCQFMFEEQDKHYTGITLGQKDVDIAIERFRNVSKHDCTFLPYPDTNFDLIFARHILEHSPFPLLTLMEWHRVSKKYLVLVFHAWEYWLVGGKNHYSMLTKEQLWFLLDRAGWEVLEKYDFETSDPRFMEFFRTEYKLDDRNWVGPPKIVEYRMLCEKKKEEK